MMIGKLNIVSRLSHFIAWVKDGQEESHGSDGAVGDEFFIVVVI